MTMANPTSQTTHTLTVRRTFAASRDRVFRAWTDPEELKQWWRLDESYTTPMAEMDLRVGGKYRLAMKPPQGDARIVGGVFREIHPPRDSSSAGVGKEKRDRPAVRHW